MANEKDFETAIAKYPELIEEGLRLVQRQSILKLPGQRHRMDLYFQDRLDNPLVVELKWGAIKFEDIGQIMSYAGYLVSGKPVREMLVGNRVPPNLQAILDHHGVEWKEITASQLCVFLRAKGDEQLAKAFDGDETIVATKLKRSASAMEPLRNTKGTQRSGGTAALFAPIEGKWLEAAREHFAAGNESLMFGTDASIGPAAESDARYVYFKRKGETEVSSRAELIEVTPENRALQRLAGHDKHPYRIYYVFRNLKGIKPIQLSELRYYNTDRALRNDVPGARIIQEPETTELG